MIEGDGEDQGLLEERESCENGNYLGEDGFVQRTVLDRQGGVAQSAKQTFEALTVFSQQLNALLCDRHPRNCLIHNKLTLLLVLVLVLVLNLSKFPDCFLDASIFYFRVGLDLDCSILDLILSEIC